MSAGPPSLPHEKNEREKKPGAVLQGHGAAARLFGIDNVNIKKYQTEPPCEAFSYFHNDQLPPALFFSSSSEVSLHIFFFSVPRPATGFSLDCIAFFFFIPFYRFHQTRKSLSKCFRDKSGRHRPRHDCGKAVPPGTGADSRKRCQGGPNGHTPEAPRCAGVLASAFK